MGMGEVMGGEVMVEGPYAPTWNDAVSCTVQAAVSECWACSLCRDHVPIAPVLPQIAPYALVTDHPESWPTRELERLCGLVGLTGHHAKIHALSCAEPDPVPAQLARCRTNLHNSLWAAGVPAAVVAGDWAVAGLGFTDGNSSPIPSWRLGGRVGIWWSGRVGLEGVFCVFVDLPDGRNKRRVLDQLHVAKQVVEGDVSAMDLVGGGPCCGENGGGKGCLHAVTWVDERGLPWCNGHRGARR